MNDYQTDDMMDEQTWQAGVWEIARQRQQCDELRGFTSPSPRRNAADALAAWEAMPEWSIRTNGLGYVICPADMPMPDSWWQTSPEEIEAYLAPAPRAACTAATGWLPRRRR